MSKELKNITYQIKYENIINSIVKLIDFYEDAFSTENPQKDYEEKIKDIMYNKGAYEALRNILSINNE